MGDEMVCVEMLNREARVAMLSDGTRCEITDFLGSDGAVTDDVDEAVIAIVKLPRGWCVVELKDFTPVGGLN